MNKWKALWSKKGENTSLSIDNTNLLSALFTASGYESKVAKTNVNEWVKFIHVISDTCNITPAKSVFEFGCGAGSFLYNINTKKVGGADYSSGLIENAKRIINSNDFLSLEAIQVPILPKYDVVLAVGCFLYFPDENYAGQVLEIMVEKAIETIAIVDINDYDEKELAEKTRRSIAGEDYDKLYEGLDHLYFKKDYFESFAKNKGLRCNILPHPLPCYPYRYNVFLSK